MHATYNLWNYSFTLSLPFFLIPAWSNLYGPHVGVCRIVYDIAFYLGCWRACRRIHDQLLDNVMRLPGRFYDTTPLGRILQRFSKDVEVVDSKLPELLTDWVICAVEVKIP